MKKWFWLVRTFICFLILFIMPIQAEVKEMDEKLPQPDDPVLFSVTEKNVTMDIVSLDWSRSRSRSIPAFQRIRELMIIFLSAYVSLQ